MNNENYNVEALVIVKKGQIKVFEGTLGDLSADLELCSCKIKNPGKGYICLNGRMVIEIDKM